jgi:hypothetical protein
MRDFDRPGQFPANNGRTASRPAARIKLRQLRDSSLPRGPRLTLALAAGVTIGFSYAAGAAAPEASSKTPQAAPPLSCQDQLMVDRRDNPEIALKKFHQCNAVRDIGINMEYFTFWYITLPDGSPSKQDTRFEKTWKNNISVLRSRAIDLEKEKAIQVLDDSIVRGLKRGRREDLIGQWLAHHDSAIFGDDSAMAAQEPAKPSGAPPSEAAAKVTPVSMPAPASAPSPAAAAQKVVAVPATTPPPEASASPPPRPKQRSTSRVHRVRTHRMPPEYASDGRAESASDALNRSELAREWYDGPPFAAAPPPYPPPYYYAPVGLPPVEQSAAPPSAAYAPPSYPPAPAASRPAPVAAAPVPYPAPAAAPAPMPASAPPFPIAQELDKNVRTMANQIEQNFHAFEQNFIKPNFFRR